MSDVILYSFRRCPYAMRARMALAVSGQNFELREVKLSAKPTAMIEASPKATVPVLVLPDGAVIDESREIMRWALLRHDPEHWLDGEDQSLIEINDGPFKHHLDRYKYPNRYDGDALWHREAAADLLVPIEQRLRAQAYLCGPTRSFTDAAIMPFIRQFVATDQSWFDAQPLPAVSRWLAGQLSSAMFKQIMMRQAVWTPEDPAGQPICRGGLSTALL